MSYPENRYGPWTILSSFMDEDYVKEFVCPDVHGWKAKVKSKSGKIIEIGTFLQRKEAEISHDIQSLRLHGLLSDGSDINSKISLCSTYIARVVKSGSDLHQIEVKVGTSEDLANPSIMIDPATEVMTLALYSLALFSL